MQRWTKEEGFTRKRLYTRGGRSGWISQLEGEEEQAWGARRQALRSLRENRLFGADQLGRSSGLGMALSGVFLGMRDRDGAEGTV